MSAAAVRGRPFAKGVSGNPGGRPAVLREVETAARALTAEAIGTLAEVMRSSRSDAARITAACALLDRAWGKPRPAEGEGDEPPMPRGEIVVRMVRPDAPPENRPVSGIAPVPSGSN